ncbi:MAG TPA: hypothetical protein VGM84_03660 [Steroidobacteraceae bacterium]|jgi:hypothetical protein
MLQHPYEGLVHDSTLYSFMALARLHPDSLGHDVFLSQGSQDQYTLFGPIAALVFNAVGLEKGAAIMTLLGQVLFYASALLFARRLVSGHNALLAVGLLVTLPSVYGALHLFSYSEPFMTPRVPAEAFVLAGLALILGGRRLLGGLCFTAALLLHPLMAAAGLVFLVAYFGVLRRPMLTIALILSALAAIALAAFFIPVGRVARFDAVWFGILHNGFAYLFPSRWPVSDLAHVTVPTATLIIGSAVATAPMIRNVCRAALLTGLGGLALAYFGADLLRIVVIAQVQPWRWLWLMNVLAVLALPSIGKALWERGLTSRAALILLVAAWIAIDERFAPVIALLAVGVAVLAPRVKDVGHGRLAIFGASAIAVLALLVFVSTTLNVLSKMSQISPDTSLYSSSYLLWLRLVRPWVAGGVLTSAVLILGWRLAGRTANSLPATTAVVALGIGLLACCAPLAASSWRQQLFPQHSYEQFAPWRSAIPPRDTVLWASGRPLVQWYLLERPSYFSSAQAAGLLFSREMAIEMIRRETTLGSQQERGDPAVDLQDTCTANPGLDFIVSPTSLGPTPYERLNVDPRRPSLGQLWLYRCAGHHG